MASGEQLGGFDDLFGFEELIEDKPKKAPVAATVPQPKTYVAAGISAFAQSKDEHSDKSKRSENEVVVPILFEKTGVRKYKVLARQKVEDEVQEKKEERKVNDVGLGVKPTTKDQACGRSERDSPNSAEQKKENISKKTIVKKKTVEKSHKLFHEKGPDNKAKQVKQPKQNASGTGQGNVIKQHDVLADKVKKSSLKVKSDLDHEKAKTKVVSGDKTAAKSLKTSDAKTGNESEKKGPKDDNEYEKKGPKNDNVNKVKMKSKKESDGVVKGKIKGDNDVTKTKDDKETKGKSVKGKTVEKIVNVKEKVKEKSNYSKVKTNEKAIAVKKKTVAKKVAEKTEVQGSIESKNTVIMNSVSENKTINEPGDRVCLEAIQKTPEKLIKQRMSEDGDTDANSTKFKCRVKLNRDPSIESIVSSDDKKEDIVNKIDESVGISEYDETDNNEAGLPKQNSDAVISRQNSLSEIKIPVDMVYDATDISVRKSGRLKSAKCASRYRGDYGIRVDTYTKLVKKKELGSDRVDSPVSDSSKLEDSDSVHSDTSRVYVSDNDRCDTDIDFQRSVLRKKRKLSKVEKDDIDCDMSELCYRCGGRRISTEDKADVIKEKDSCICAGQTDSENGKCKSCECQRNERLQNDSSGGGDIKSDYSCQVPSEHSQFQTQHICDCQPSTDATSKPGSSKQFDGGTHERGTKKIKLVKKLANVNDTVSIYAKKADHYVHSVGKSVKKSQNMKEAKRNFSKGVQSNENTKLSPELSPSNEDPNPSLVLENLRQMLFQQAGADVKVADNKPKRFECKLISSKCKTSQATKQVVTPNPETETAPENTTPRCTTPKSEATCDLLEEISVSLSSLQKQKQSSKKGKGKRKRFEDKKFILRSMSKEQDIEDTESELLESAITSSVTTARDDDQNEETVAKTKTSKKKVQSKGDLKAKAQADKTPQETTKKPAAKPKPVKCQACNHTFKTRDLLRKHYPCRIRQTRTWSQNKLRPNRAVRRPDPLPRKVPAAASKVDKSDKQRPQLIQYRKTKFRRVKGKRRRRLYQAIQELMQRRQPMKWPHLSICFDDLSFKEQSLYRIGLMCTGSSAEGLERYSMEEIDLFERHRSVAKKVSDDTKFFKPCPPDSDSSDEDDNENKPEDNNQKQGVTDNETNKIKLTVDDASETVESALDTTCTSETVESALDTTLETDQTFKTSISIPSTDEGNETELDQKANCDRLGCEAHQTIDTENDTMQQADAEIDLERNTEETIHDSNNDKTICDDISTVSANNIRKTSFVTEIYDACQVVECKESDNSELPKVSSETNICDSELLVQHIEPTKIETVDLIKQCSLVEVLENSNQPTEQRISGIETIKPCSKPHSCSPLIEVEELLTYILQEIETRVDTEVRLDKEVECYSTNDVICATNEICTTTVPVINDTVSVAVLDKVEDSGVLVSDKEHEVDNSPKNTQVIEDGDKTLLKLDDIVETSLSPDHVDKGTERIVQKAGDDATKTDYPCSERINNDHTISQKPSSPQHISVKNFYPCKKVSSREVSVSAVRHKSTELKSEALHSTENEYPVEVVSKKNYSDKLDDSLVQFKDMVSNTMLTEAYSKSELKSSNTHVNNKLNEKVENDLSKTKSDSNCKPIHTESKLMNSSLVHNAEMESVQKADLPSLSNKEPSKGKNCANNVDMFSKALVPSDGSRIEKKNCEKVNKTKLPELSQDKKVEKVKKKDTKADMIENKKIQASTSKPNVHQKSKDVPKKTDKSSTNNDAKRNQRKTSSSSDSSTHNKEKPAGRKSLDTTNVNAYSVVPKRGILVKQKDENVAGSAALPKDTAPIVKDTTARIEKDTKGNEQKKEQMKIYKPLVSTDKPSSQAKAGKEDYRPISIEDLERLVNHNKVVLEAKEKAIREEVSCAKGLIDTSKELDTVTPMKRKRSKSESFSWVNDNKDKLESMEESSKKKHISLNDYLKKKGMAPVKPKQRSNSGELKPNIPIVPDIEIETSYANFETAEECSLIKQKKEQSQKNIISKASGLLKDFLSDLGDGSAESSGVEAEQRNKRNCSKEYELDVDAEEEYDPECNYLLYDDQDEGNKYQTNYVEYTPDMPEAPKSPDIVSKLMEAFYDINEIADEQRDLCIDQGIHVKQEVVQLNLPCVDDEDSNDTNILVQADEGIPFEEDSTDKLLKPVETTEQVNINISEELTKAQGNEMGKKDEKYLDIESDVPCYTAEIGSKAYFSTVEKAACSPVEEKTVDEEKTVEEKPSEINVVFENAPESSIVNEQSVMPIVTTNKYLQELADVDAMEKVDSPYADSTSFDEDDSMIVVDEWVPSDDCETETTDKQAETNDDQTISVENANSETEPEPTVASSMERNKANVICDNPMPMIFPESGKEAAELNNISATAPHSADLECEMGMKDKKQETANTEKDENVQRDTMLSPKNLCSPAVEPETDDSIQKAVDVIPSKLQINHNSVPNMEQITHRNFKSPTPEVSENKFVSDQVEKVKGENETKEPERSFEVGVNNEVEGGHQGTETKGMDSSFEIAVVIDQVEEVLEENETKEVDRTFENSVDNEVEDCHGGNETKGVDSSLESGAIGDEVVDVQGEIGSTETESSFEIDDVNKSPVKSLARSKAIEENPNFVIKYEMNGLVIKENLLTGDKNVVDNSSPIKRFPELDNSFEDNSTKEISTENSLLSDEQKEVQVAIPKSLPEAQIKDSIGKDTESLRHCDPNTKKEEYESKAFCCSDVNEEILKADEDTVISGQDAASVSTPIISGSIDEDAALSSDEIDINIDLVEEVIDEKTLSSSLQNEDVLMQHQEGESSTCGHFVDSDFLETGGSPYQMLNGTIEVSARSELSTCKKDLDLKPSFSSESCNSTNDKKSDQLYSDVGYREVPRLSEIKALDFNSAISPPMLEKVEMGNDSTDIEEDSSSQMTVVSTGSEPPTLEPEALTPMQNYDQEEPDLTESSSKKDKLERHFLDVLGAVCETPEHSDIESEEITTSTPIRGKMETDFNENIGRHFSDAVNTIPEKPVSELQSLFDKSEKGEITLASIKNMLSPISKQKKLVSKDTLLKIQSGIAQLLTKVKKPIKKDPTWLKRDALAKYSFDKQSRIYDSESEDETLVSNLENNQESPSKKVVTDNILEMLDSLNKNGSVADNMSKLLDILAENLGFIAGSKSNKSLFQDSDSDSDDLSATLSKSTTPSAEKTQKEMIASFLEDGDLPPSLDDIPTAEDTDTWNGETEHSSFENIVNVDENERFQILQCENLEEPKRTIEDTHNQIISTTMEAILQAVEQEIDDQQEDIYEYGHDTFEQNLMTGAVVTKMRDREDTSIEYMTEDEILMEDNVKHSEPIAQQRQTDQTNDMEQDVEDVNTDYETDDMQESEKELETPEPANNKVYEDYPVSDDFGKESVSLNKLHSGCEDIPSYAENDRIDTDEAILDDYAVVNDDRQQARTNITVMSQHANNGKGNINIKTLIDIKVSPASTLEKIDPDSPSVSSTPIKKSKARTIFKSITELNSIETDEDSNSSEHFDHVKMSLNLSELKVQPEDTTWGHSDYDAHSDLSSIDWERKYDSDTEEEESLTEKNASTTRMEEDSNVGGQSLKVIDTDNSSVHEVSKVIYSEKLPTTKSIIGEFSEVIEDVDPLSGDAVVTKKLPQISDFETVNVNDVDNNFAKVNTVEDHKLEVSETDVKQMEMSDIDNELASDPDVCKKLSEESGDINAEDGLSNYGDVEDKQSTMNDKDMENHSPKVDNSADEVSEAEKIETDPSETGVTENLLPEYSDIENEHPTDELLTDTSIEKQRPDNIDVNDSDIRPTNEKSTLVSDSNKDTQDSKTESDTVSITSDINICTKSDELLPTDENEYKIEDGLPAQAIDDNKSNMENEKEHVEITKTNLAQSFDDQLTKRDEIKPESEFTENSSSEILLDTNDETVPPLHSDITVKTIDKFVKEIESDSPPPSVENEALSSPVINNERRILVSEDKSIIEDDENEEIDIADGKISEGQRMSILINDSELTETNDLEKAATCKPCETQSHDSEDDDHNNGNKDNECLEPKIEQRLEEHVTAKDEMKSREKVNTSSEFVVENIGQSKAIVEEDSDEDTIEDYDVDIACDNYSDNDNDLQLNSHEENITMNSPNSNTQTDVQDDVKRGSVSAVKEVIYDNKLLKANIVVNKLLLHNQDVVNVSELEKTKVQNMPGLFDEYEGLKNSDDVTHKTQNRSPSPASDKENEEKSQVSDPKTIDDFTAEKLTNEAYETEGTKEGKEPFDPQSKQESSHIIGANEEIDLTTSQKEIQQTSAKADVEEFTNKKKTEEKPYQPVITAADYGFCESIGEKVKRQQRERARPLTYNPWQLFDCDFEPATKKPRKEISIFRSSILEKRAREKSLPKDTPEKTDKPKCRRSSKDSAHKLARIPKNNNYHKNIKECSISLIKLTEEMIQKYTCRKRPLSDEENSERPPIKVKIQLNRITIPPNSPYGSTSVSSDTNRSGYESENESSDQETDVDTSYLSDKVPEADETKFIEEPKDTISNTREPIRIKMKELLTKMNTCEESESSSATENVVNRNSYTANKEMKKPNDNEAKGVFDGLGNFQRDNDIQFYISDPESTASKKADQFERASAKSLDINAEFSETFDSDGDCDMDSSVAEAQKKVEDILNATSDLSDNESKLDTSKSDDVDITPDYSAHVEPLIKQRPSKIMNMVHTDIQLSESDSEDEPMPFIPLKEQVKSRTFDKDICNPVVLLSPLTATIVTDVPTNNVETLKTTSEPFDIEISEPFDIEPVSAANENLAVTSDKGLYNENAHLSAVSSLQFETFDRKPCSVDSVENDGMYFAAIEETNFDEVREAVDNLESVTIVSEPVIVENDQPCMFEVVETEVPSVVEMDESSSISHTKQLVTQPHSMNSPAMESPAVLPDILAAESKYLYGINEDSQSSAEVVEELITDNIVPTDNVITTDNMIMADNIIPLGNMFPNSNMIATGNIMTDHIMETKNILPVGNMRPTNNILPPSNILQTDILSTRFSHPSNPNFIPSIPPTTTPRNELTNVLEGFHVPNALIEGNNVINTSADNCGYEMETCALDLSSDYEMFTSI